MVGDKSPLSGRDRISSISVPIVSDVVERTSRPRAATGLRPVRRRGAPPPPPGGTSDPPPPW